LTVQGKEKRTILNSVKVQAVEARGEIEHAQQTTLVCKECPVNKVNSLCVLSYVQLRKQNFGQEKLTYLLYVG